MLNYLCVSRMKSTRSWWICFFNVFLDSVWKHFVGYFCIYVHKRNWFVVLFYISSYSLGIRVTVISWNDLGNVPTIYILWSNLKNIESLVEFCAKTIRPWVFCCLFLVGRLLMTASISLGVMGLFRWFIWLGINFGIWYLSRKLSISSRFSSFIEYRLFFFFFFFQ